MRRTALTLLAAMTIALPPLTHAQRLTPSISVQHDLAERMQTVCDRSPFTFLNDTTLKGDRLEAMKFLYAYMILPDLTAHNADFYLANVDASLRAAREMPWGDSVPEREWLHFVLPVRINNEALDMARPQFYEQLRDRVRGLDMEQAILEVNHWCHEKVSYQPSDARTSTPLSTVSQAIGRCGEESTFAVAALRSVGIPARQVYTPRWAHTDDNHAWVEAWANGRWHFIGACEPEPVTDLAWFNAPASRGMMMTTNVFGRYDGPEEKLQIHEPLTVINVTENYAPVDTLRVRVLDTAGKPVPEAKVNFCIYNYAEFYPVASKCADTAGEASVLAGLGDMVVWASDGSRFGLTKGTPGSKDILTVILDKDHNFNGVIDMELTPPAQRVKMPDVSEELRARNDRRLVAEDAVRRYYISTFASDADARILAAPLALDADRTAAVLTQARGNSRSIMDFLISTPDSLRSRALRLLEVVNEKDRRDISREVLADNLYALPEAPEGKLYDDFVLNPRVASEPLVPYKAFFRTVIPLDRRAAYRANPELWAQWTLHNIHTDSVWNPRSVAMTPQGVWQQRCADPHSRALFFVAAARAMDIPARIDPVTGKTQYADEKGAWIDVNLNPSKTKKGTTATGQVSFPLAEDSPAKDPRYYSQFALSRIEHGEPRQMEYEEGWGLHQVAQATPRMDCGQYMLVTGQRMADGSVLARTRFFTVEKGKSRQVPVQIRRDDNGVQVIGSLNAENIYHDLTDNTDRSILSHTGRGYYVLGLIAPGSEPSAHALNDISALKTQFDDQGTPILLLFADGDAASRFDPTPYTSLPVATRLGVDSGGVSLAELAASLETDGSLPLFVIADSFNRVVFSSQGYTIGLGERLLDVLSKLR